MKRSTIAFICGGMLALTGGASAAEFVFAVDAVDETGTGRPLGRVVVRDTPYGLLLIPDLKGLPPGVHGFHVHETALCGAMAKPDGGSPVAALAAGGHYDPAKSGRHQGPYGDGHLGDLPVLIVGVDGSATVPVLAPRLTTADLRGRSLIIHAGGDSYADQPVLGGGGGRIACGTVP